MTMRQSLLMRSVKDDVPVAEVVDDAIIIGTAAVDNIPLSQELLLTQEFSTTDLPPLQGNGVKNTASTVTPVAATPAHPVASFVELPIIPAILELPIEKHVLKHTRISFKLQGIVANKLLFLNHNKVHANVIAVIPMDYHVTGLITNIPSVQNNQHYIVIWEKRIFLPMSK